MAFSDVVVILLLTPLLETLLCPSLPAPTIPFPWSHYVSQFPQQHPHARVTPSPGSNNLRALAALRSRHHGRILQLAW